MGSEMCIRDSVWCVRNGYIPEARVDEAAARVQQQLIDVGL